MPTQNHIVLPDGRVMPLVLRRSDPDVRDKVFGVYPLVKALPDSTDLRPQDKVGVVDQSFENSCTGNTGAPAFSFAQGVSSVQFWNASRRYAYWAARTADGSSTSVDNGATIRGLVTGMYKFGMVSEAQMPYIAGQYALQPSDAIKAIAAKYHATGYSAVQQTHDSIVAALAARKVVLYGFAVYSNFNTISSNGLVPTPSGSLLGYHANRLMGHRDSDSRFISRNCWGTSFGDHGDIYQRYVDILNPNYAFDFWVLDGVTGESVDPTPVPPPPAPVVVSISPATATVQVGKTVQFTTNVPCTFVSNGGAVTSNGLFTAPSTTGSYVVQARAIADPTKYVNASVTVVVGPSPTPTPTPVYATSIVVRYSDGTQKTVLV